MTAVKKELPIKQIDLDYDVIMIIIMINDQEVKMVGLTKKANIIETYKSQNILNK